LSYLTPDPPIWRKFRCLASTVRDAQFRMICAGILHRRGALTLAHADERTPAKPVMLADRDKTVAYRWEAPEPEDMTDGCLQIPQAGSAVLVARSGSGTTQPYLARPGGRRSTCWS
jgi:hypothetical protein